MMYIGRAMQILRSVILSFVGAITKLRNAIISFVMSVRPSARNNSTPTGWIFMKFCLITDRKSVKNIQVSLKSDSSKG